VKGVLDSAVANNLDFVAITEHNTFSHHSEIDRLEKDYPNLLILKGEEVTTYGGHINVWGLESGDWVDFRLVPGQPKEVSALVDEAKELGVLASANHPAMGCAGCGWTYGDWSVMDAVEIWNAKWDKEDEESLKIWDELLRAGKRVTAIGSSDTHLPPYEPSDYPTNLAVGSPTVQVAAKTLGKKSILNGIKEGRVTVTGNSSQRLNFGMTTPTGKAFGPGESGKIANENATFGFRVSYDGFAVGSKVKLISYSGSTTQVKEFVDSNSSGTFSVSQTFAGPGFVRLEVRNDDGSMAAFTNPIWIKGDS